MIRDRVAIITGASSGIGEALAERLAHEGAVVVLAARRRERIESLAASLRAQGFRAEAIETDVTRAPDGERLVRETIARFGRLDILVNNAGRGHCGSVEETTDEVIGSIFAVNVYALWHTVRPALPQMRKQGSGHIINVASMAGKIGFPFNSAYVAAKHACVGFTAALRMELVETGIHATVVCPAGVETDWAASTEGAPMLPLFQRAAPLTRTIAGKRRLEPPAIEGPVQASVVAERILACLENPVPELYTHRGAEEFVRLAATDPAEAERRLLPGALGEREAYEQIKKEM
jgi:uncharacterized protein